jgi:surface antigen
VAAGLPTLLWAGLAAAEVEVRVPIRDALAPADRRLAEATLQQALETHPSNLGLTWNQPSGNRGSATPLRTFQTESGIFCRDFREIVILTDGSVDTAVDTACRDSDGIWKRVAR